MSFLEQAKGLGQDTVSTYSDGVPSRAAAALAYRGIFSLAPLLFISIVVVSIFLGQEAAQAQVIGVVTNVLDEESAQMVSNIISATSERTNQDYTIASLIGFGILVYAASALFKELKIALNTVWGLPPVSKEGGPMAFIFTQLTAIAMVLVVGFAFLTLILVNVVISVLDTYIFQGEFISLRLGSLAGSFAVLILLIMIVYRLVPDSRVPWSDLWVGSVVTALLIALGIWGIGFYMNISNVGSSFGAAGAIIILLLWLYYTGLVFLFGASFARAYALNFGSQQTPLPPIDEDQSDEKTEETEETEKT